MNVKMDSKDGDVSGAGYEFVGNARQSAGTMESYIGKKHTREKKYLDFVLNPDIEAPIRMPSDFTYPTNLLSYKQNVQVTLGSTGDFIGYFAPQNSLLNSSAAPTQRTCTYAFIARNPALASYQSLSYLGHLTSGTAANYASRTADPSTAFPYQTNFDSARVIGAVCQVQYIGSLQDTSGMLTIAADLAPANSLPIGERTPPTNSQMFNLLLYKKYNASEQTRSTWFPVDPSVQNFVYCVAGNATLTQNDLPDFSQLVFYFNGYGYPANATLDVTVEIYYEGVPNAANSNLFVASQGTSKERKEDAWNEILDVGKKNIGQILISGARTVADWVGGPVGGMAKRAINWLAT